MGPSLTSRKLASSCVVWGLGDGGSGVAGCTWDLAYAVTCHKAQGSEWPVVVVVVEPAGPIGSREGLYTAVSRARRLGVLLGDAPAVAQYVRRESLPDRKTFLKELIRGDIR